VPARLLRHCCATDPAVGGARGARVDELVRLVSRMPVDGIEGRPEATQQVAVTVDEVMFLSLEWLQDAP
jgi:hypothetical protein